MKKIVSMILIVLMLTLGAVPAFATSPQKAVGTLESIGIKSYNMIMKGDSMIIDNENGAVTLLESTETYYKVDEIKVIL